MSKNMMTDIHLFEILYRRFECQKMTFSAAECVEAQKGLWPCKMWTCVCVYLFEAGWHTPATGLHDAIVTAHVLAYLSVLFTPLLSAGQQCRVTEERRNTVTGQSGSNGEGRRKEGKKERSVSSLASQQQEMERRDEWTKMRNIENKATEVVASTI